METAVFLAVLTLFSTMVLGLFKIIDMQNKTQEKLSVAIDANTQSNREIAVATKQQAIESKERNGHLADLAKENQKANVQGNIQMMKALKEIKTQNVKEQTVAHQTINSQE